MSGETLEIDLFAVSDGEDAFSWLVAISANGQPGPDPTMLRHPFNEGQRSECRWYVEQFVCKDPYSVSRARNTANDLQQYSKSLLDQLGLVKLVKDDFASHSRGNRSITISIREFEGAKHSVHQLHWELLEDPSLWDNEVQVTVKRIVISDEISEQNGKSAVVHDVPRVNGLLVVARDLSPGSNRYDDISPHLALGVLARIQDDLQSSKSQAACLHLEVVRPGSLEALEKHLKRATEIHGKNYYHFVHFDVHGVVKSKEGAGYLLFNKPGPDLHTTVQEDARAVAEILGQHGVAVAVLNACESARANCGDAANIAKTFARSGVQNVLAMSFRISSSAAELLLRAFYHSLFLEGNTFSHAARRAREVLRRHPERQARLGLTRMLIDYFVPVVYSCGQDSRLTPTTRNESIPKGLQDSSDFALRTAQTAGNDRKQLTGREFDLLRLEKKLLAQGRVHLTGRAGVGKSALLRHASRIWQQTSFIDILLFVDFTKVRSLADAVGSLVSQIPSLEMRERLTLERILQAMVTSPTFDSAMIAEVLLGACSKPRLMIIFDGLHVFYPTDLYSKPDRPSKGAVPMLRRFMDALLSLGDAASPHAAIYHIVVSRLDSSPLPFSETVQEGLSSEKNRFTLPSLRLSDSIELSQSALRASGVNVDTWLDADLNELELLVGLLDGNPSAILHVLPQMSQTGMLIREFRGLVQHGILPKSYAGHAVEDMSKEIDNLFHGLRDEPRDLVLLLSTVWHEGLGLRCLLGWTISHKMCMKAQSGLVFEDVRGRGLIDVGPGIASLGEEADVVVTWIHPLLTICGRRIAYEILTGRQSQSAAAALVLSTLGVQFIEFDETMFSEQTQILCADFKAWFLRSLNTFNMNRAAMRRIKGLGYEVLHATWSLAAGNLATCLSICTRQPYLPIDQWPFEYFMQYLAYIHVVGSPAQVADYAKSFEQLFEIFIYLNRSHAIQPLHQLYALTTVISLARIYSANVKDPAKHEKYVHMGLQIVKESEERFGTFEVSEVQFLKGLTQVHHAGYLLTSGPPEQAVKVWKTMLDSDKCMLENPNFRSPEWSSEQIQSFAHELSTDEAEEEAVAKRLKALSVNSTLEAAFKSKRSFPGFIRDMVSAADKGEDPRAIKTFSNNLAKVADRMEGWFKQAEAVGFRGMKEDERWWDEGDHDINSFISRFDSPEGNLAGLEIAESTGNSAEASERLANLFGKAFQNLELDEAEEYFKALGRHSEHFPSQEGHSLDWEKGTEAISLFKTTTDILLGNPAKETDGMSDRHELVAELTEKKMRELKENNAPREAIEAREIFLEMWQTVPNLLPDQTYGMDRSQASQGFGNLLKLLSSKWEIRN